jgi:hypothetical protein
VPCYLLRCHWQQQQTSHPSCLLLLQQWLQKPLSLPSSQAKGVLVPGASALLDTALLALARVLAAAVCLQVQQQ